MIAITLALFVAALLMKGLSHDLLLEAGVFLVSVKLIIMAHKDTVSNQELLNRLDDMQKTLAALQQGENPAKASD